MIHNVPVDNKHTRDYWEDVAHGCCGPAAIAALDNTSVQLILDLWTKHFGKFKGHAKHSDVIDFVENHGHNVKRIAGKKATSWDKSRKGYYIVRIQWEGDGDVENFAGWGHWARAAAASHYIAVKGDAAFCNGVGYWFPVEQIPKYLREMGQKGHITSIIELDRTEQQHSDTEVSEAEALRTPPTTEKSVGIRAGDLL